MYASFPNPAVSGLDLLNLFPPVLQPCFPLPQGLVLYSASLQAHQYQQEFHTASDFHSSVIQLYFLGAGYEVCTALQQVVLCGGMGSKTLSSDVNLYCHQHGKRGSTIALSSIGVTLPVLPGAVAQWDTKTAYSRGQVWSILCLTGPKN